MAMPCAACTHAKRREIDAAIVAGTPNRRIAAQYGMGESSIRRHREHVAEPLAKATRKAELARADNLCEQVLELQRITLELLDTARTDDDRRIVLGAVKEARGNVELIGEFTGELARRGTATATATAEAKASASAAIEAQLQALTDEELAEELEAALMAVRGRIAAKEATCG